MIRRLDATALAVIVGTLGTSLSCFGDGLEGTAPGATIQVGGHPWRPPFGLERIGQPLPVTVEIPAELRANREFTVVASLQGQEIARTSLSLPAAPPYRCRVTFEKRPSELALIAQESDGTVRELARVQVEPVPFEAEAIARPDHPVNPVDLGAILVPSDWLLLGPGQLTGSIDVAAVSHTGNLPGTHVTAWFESAPSEKSRVEIPLLQDRRSQVHLTCPPVPVTGDHDSLHVSILSADGTELGQKSIQTMIVRNSPRWPEFGAAETKLRYDAPISVRGENAEFSSLSYAAAWDEKLHDVVVALPNGARFVFWRGSSYVPFWAGRCNTGLSYEWAETSPPADGFTDCVEPLMDKELRYGRVNIIESTPARIHVRWSYQSCDFQYKVWGDSAVEDYYFYRDGFGTRSLTLQSEPTGDYELSEFIILTPQSTYPLSVLPSNLVDVLFIDGQKRELTFPFFPAEQGEKAQSRDLPAVYRVRLHRDDPMAAVYFNQLDKKLPPAIFAPFFDKGELVTPTYWGSHWPLARGKTTGYAIDDRLQFTPCHNSVMSWARSRPQPVRTAQMMALDTLGRSKPMIVQTWVWLIGTSDANDERLLNWARSFAQPPQLEVKGARLEAESYVPERRAIRLVVEEPVVTMTLEPAVPCVNPVLELVGAPKVLRSIEMAGRVLDAKEYAWDGQTLWLDATLRGETPLRLVFDHSAR